VDRAAVPVRWLAAVAAVAAVPSAAVLPSAAAPRHGPVLRNLGYSDNWSGYAATRPAGRGFGGVRGQWTVPAVAARPAGYSSSWVGVDGDTSGDRRDLLQAGTAQDTSGGYFAWWEMLPSPAVEIVGPAGGPRPVRPGDRMACSVLRTSPGHWTVTLRNATRGWQFRKTVRYGGPGASVEWIEEAPQVDGRQSRPDDFRTVHFAGTLVSLGGRWQGATLTSDDGMAMVNATSTKILAMPSSPSGAAAGGQAFRITYVTAPGRPGDARATAGADAVAVSWRPPARDGGTVIYDYQVREYRWSKLARTLTAAGTSITVTGLSPGVGYRFSVAAVNSGGWTSAFTAPTAQVRPRG
jgi:hypothetical protein